MSRLDFLKLIGGGSAAAGAAVASPRRVYPDAPPAPSHGIPPDGPVDFPLETWQPRTTADQLARWESIWREVVDWTFYDRFHLKPGEYLPANFGLFKNSLGTMCPWCNHVCMDDHTNMAQPAAFPAPNEFFLKRIFFTVDPCVRLQDVEEFSRRFSWDLSILQKRYAAGLVRLNEPYPAELRQLVRKDGRPRRLVPRGVADSAKLFPDSGGLLIPYQHYFTFSMHANDSWQVPKDGNGLDVFVSLDGVYARAVQ